MNRFSYTTITSILLCTIITTGFFYFPRTARAIDVFGSASGLVCDAYNATVGKLVDELELWAEDWLKGKGTEEIENAADTAESKVNPLAPIAVHDSGNSSEIKRNARSVQAGQEATQKVAECKELVRKTMLSLIKKHILDVIVNDIVLWIQTGDSFGDLGARFTQSWEKTFDNVKQDVAGGLAEDLGLGFLCKPFSFQVRLQLAKPQEFKQRVRCTLNDIAGNIGDFAKDFNSGGWYSYREVMKPKNNLWGAQLLVQDELIQREEKKVTAKKQELQAGFGFKDQKICTRWERIVKEDDGTETKQHITPGGACESSSPSHSCDDIKWDNDKYYKETPSLRHWREEWTCANEEGVTPGRIIGETATKAIGHDFDYIINADDLADYLTAISDALINRLVTESVSGLAGVYDSMKGSSARGSDPGSQNYYNNGRSGLQDFGLIYVSSTLGNQQAQTQSITYRNIQNQIENASTTIPVVKTNYENAKSKNNNLIILLSNPRLPPPPGLIACYTYINTANPASSTIITSLNLLPQASSTLETATTLWAPEILQDIAAINGLETERVSIKTELALYSPSNISSTTLTNLTNRANALTSNITAQGLKSFSTLSRESSAYTQKLGEQTLYAPWCQ